MPQLTSQLNSALTLKEASQRLLKLKGTINEVAKKAGRCPSEITILGVSKTFEADLVKLYLEAGLNNFGESYVKEAQAKVTQIAEWGLTPQWHFIGHLQTNKSKYVAPLFSTLHSLDKLELAAELNRHLESIGRNLDVYIQVNVAGEASKSGLSPSALPYFLENLSQYQFLNCIGLMTIPPYDSNPEKSRPYFAALRELKEEYAPNLPGLSMGMSGDLEVAISEGATIIRVGTALFGDR